MQKQSFSIEYAPISIPPEKNGLLCGPYLQHDAPILNLHTHEVPELGICLEGNGIFVVEGKVLPFHTGDISVIPAGENHLAQSRSGTVSRWYWLYPDIARMVLAHLDEPDAADFSGYRGPGFRNIIPAQEQPALVQILRECFQALLDSGTASENRAALYLTLFALELRKLRPQQPPPEQLPAEALSRLQPALRQLMRNYRSPLAIGKLAAGCSLSEPHFRRLFKKALRKTPQEYLNTIRISVAAAELVNTCLPVTQIARESGFPTVSCFNRQFRRLRGVSPRDWRSSGGKKEDSNDRIPAVGEQV